MSPLHPDPPAHCPIRSPYDIRPCDPTEVAPLVEHLRANRPVAESAVFPRGTLLADGRLDLCKQSLGPAGCRSVIEGLAGNTQVTSLLLGTDGIGDSGAADVAGLIEDNSNLEVIYLGCNLITAAGTARLCDTLTENQTVTGLWLKRNPLGPEGAEHLARMLRRNRTLRTLDLVNTEIGPDGLAAILEALTEENRTVTRLYLGGNGISENDTGRLAELLRRNPILEALLLNVNHLGDNGAAILTEGLRENHTLRELGLASCGISSQGAGMLFEALSGHPALVDLDLGYSRSTRVLGAQGNRLQDTGAGAAAGFLQEDPPLRRLNLRSTGIGATGRERLVEAMAQNTHLLELVLDGKQDARIAEACARNREHCPDFELQSPDAARIRSVYRTTGS